MKVGRRVMMPVYLDAQRTALKRLSDRTRVPMQIYLREGLDDLLKKYAKKGGLK